MHCANNQIDLLLLLQSPAACAAVEKRAKEIAESLEAEYWSVSAKTGEFRSCPQAYMNTFPFQPFFF